MDVSLGEEDSSERHPNAHNPRLSSHRREHNRQNPSKSVVDDLDLQTTHSIDSTPACH
jgi:hypothetical protein